MKGGGNQHQNMKVRQMTEMPLLLSPLKSSTRINFGIVIVNQDKSLSFCKKFYLNICPKTIVYTLLKAIKGLLKL